jgi:hypothetical protein
LGCRQLLGRHHRRFLGVLAKNLPESDRRGRGLNRFMVKASVLVYFRVLIRPYDAKNNRAAEKRFLGIAGRKERER